MFRPAIATLATIFVPLLLSLPSVASEAGPACGAFVLTGGDKTITAVDNPPEGRSPGDKRVGTRVLLADDGQPIGEEVFIATTAATATADRTDLMATDFYFRFANGWISGSAVYHLPDPDDPLHARGVDLTVVVTGGAGAFASASGQVVLKAGDPPGFSFDLSCG